VPLEEFAAADAAVVAVPMMSENGAKVTRRQCVQIVGIQMVTHGQRCRATRGARRIEEN